MEDGSNGNLLDTELLVHTKNGVVTPTMANFPDGVIAVSKDDKVNHTENSKVNGDNITECNVFEGDSYSSESDALVIDESVPKKQKGSRKKNTQKSKAASSEESTNRDGEVLTHSNPYFNESLFELTQIHQNQNCQEANLDVANDDTTNTPVDIKDDKQCKVKSKKSKGKTKPKLREYAQYLGLQPTVQFKCSKCGRAGFESLTTLHDHVIQCNSVQNVQEETSENSFSGFKLTRKVFLCSACGTYYENWNLYMHMLEFHRRYICLYCLGMFSILEDLCQHIQSRHNLEPGHKNTLDEFFNVYNEPCYVVCCECNKLFSEQDNFFYHNCISNKNSKGKKAIKQQITPENHVTGDSIHIAEEMSKNINLNDPQECQDIIQETSEKENINDPKQTPDDCVSMETKDISRDLTNSEQLNDLNDQQEVEKHNEMAVSEDEIRHLNDNLDESRDSEIIDRFRPEDSYREPGAEYLTEQDNSNTVNDLSLEENVVVEGTTEENSRDTANSESEPVETRKVPKLSLKLPKLATYSEPEMEAEDSEDSEKLTMEVDQIESENENDTEINSILNPNLVDADLREVTQISTEPQMQVADTDIAIMELQLEQPLDKFDPKVLIQKCLRATVPICIYCNHARKIAVNGKQLGLHCIAEHRFSAVVNSITAEELIPESFVNRIKESLPELESQFFNLEASFSDEAVTFSHLFECFQCRFSTTVHKELYLHNRKFHSKNLLLCIMCKSNFYSYSELICHLCPGVYVLDYDLQFRCCMCINDDLPSSFRLMVHLRKRHNVCDVCLEMCHTQYRLSNHVWKHKLHHFCYRCGIAYRNKPDITRHLFWKHGTESVLCKKCLQKKWPHVYHFCVPPTSFTCDECNSTYSRAVSLKVHKRIHTDERKHACNFEGCIERFISKKLMLKHEQRHREPPEDSIPDPEVEKSNEDVKDSEIEENKSETIQEEEKIEDKPKPKIDVLDLPELNLSESDSSDSETEATNNKDSAMKDHEIEDTEQVEKEKPCELISQEDAIEVNNELTEVDNPNSVIQNIWDNFKNYQASKEKLDNMINEVEKAEHPLDIPVPQVEEVLTIEMALRDHDYCIDPEKKVDTSIIEVKPALTMTESVDHDYCSSKIEPPITEKSPEKTASPGDSKEEKQKKITDSSSSDSSSDSDSSSCSCGSNCSCSSSSGSSSSTSESSNSDSSTEEGRRRQQARRQRRKDRAKKLNKENEAKVVDVVATDLPPIVIETPIRESDLETTESETDEEFYDKAPQKLAKKILEEKRQQLLAIMGPNNVPNGSFIESTSRPPTPPAGVVEEEEPKPKKKSKSKKRKKKKSERRAEAGLEDNREYSSEAHNIPIPSYYQYHQPPTVAPITLTLPRNSPIPNQCATTPPMPHSYLKSHSETFYSRQDSSDSNLRASKRRRVPNKFYGYSSDEDQDKVHSSVPKWRKTEVPQTSQSPMIVPPITIKTTPQAVQQPTVEPISIRTGAHLSDFKVQRPRPRPSIPPIRLINPKFVENDSATESNDSSSEEQPALPKPKPKPKPIHPQLYCYCRCPYDEVSEMIGCDANRCAIEWFHFECVGIMVPPKGHWYCPDCRKKKQYRRRMLLESW